MALSRAQAPRVSVSGQIEPIREITLTSTLAAPIQSVDVEIGDPVETNDLLGRYNVSDLQRELSQQEATQAQSATEALSAVEAAQRELNQYQDMLNSGLIQKSRAQSLHCARHKVPMTKRMRPIRRSSTARRQK